MSQALYRKWRPQTWEEVVGQQHVVQTLRNALASGMTKLVQESKSSASMVIGVLVLLVAVILAYWWWTSNASNIVSQTWINWWDSRSSPMAIEFMPTTFSG